MSIDLLREVIRQNPYKVKETKPVWVDIALAVTRQWNDARKVLTWQTAKNHTGCWIKTHKQNKAESAKKSGVSEKKQTIDDLCETIVQLQDEGNRALQKELEEKNKKEAKLQKKKEDEGKLLRKASMKNLKGDASDSDGEPGSGDESDEARDDDGSDDSEVEEVKPPKNKRRRATRMQVNRSVLDLLDRKLSGMINNEAKKLDNEARKIALHERMMAMKEDAKGKGTNEKVVVDAPPSTSRVQDHEKVVQVAGPGGEPRMLTQLQPASFDLDTYPFQL